MKFTLKVFLISFLILAECSFAYSQPGGGGNPGGGGGPVPITGIEILLGVGALFGAKKLLGHKKKHSNP